MFLSCAVSIAPAIENDILESVEANTKPFQHCVQYSTYLLYNMSQLTVFTTFLPES